MRLDSIPCESDSLSIPDLNNYLAQIVLYEIDDGIRKVKNNIDSDKQIIKSLSEEIKGKKSRLDELTLELSRRKQLKVVLNLIETLSKEGVFIGQNRSKVKKLLETIEDKDFSTLRSIEQRLMIYRPEI